MKVIRSVREMQQAALSARREGRRIGFVPTMGCLHAGHLSLVSLARERSDLVVVSIFVNPTQFLPGEDFAAYPRPYERDEAACRDAGVDVLFHPEAGEMYERDHSVSVEEHALSPGLCGASRPGHFRGVTTVVAKLFNIVLPDVAVFGQKDAQQARVIRRMVRDLNFPVEVMLGPIVRESDGLAMSSRNRYLAPDERRQALCLRRALDEASRLAASGERSVARLKAAMESVIGSYPLAVIDYIDFVDEATLQRVDGLEKAVLAAVAVRIGKTRLIDNTVLEAGSRP